MTGAESLSEALDAVARPLRGLSGLARLLAGGALAVLVLAIAAWLARFGWLTGPEWILVAWLLALALVSAGFVLARRAIGALGPWQVGRDLERGGAWRRGALTTVLDSPAANTSATLHVAAAGQRADEVHLRGPGALGPTIVRQRHLGRQAGAMLAVALVALVAARPATGAPARLWHPLAAWRALVAPVQLRARDALVARGQPAVLVVTVIGHRRATLFMRAPGEAWQASAVALDSNGTATVTTAPLAAELVARVEAAGRSSPEVHVGIRLAAFLGAFTATAHYPAYLGLADEVLPTTGDTLILPEGTRLSLAGRATTPLGAARIAGPDGDMSLAVTGSTFQGDLLPRRSGLWRMTVTPAGGGALEGDAPSLPIRVVIDSAPVVEIPVPGVDTIAVAGRSLALVIGIRDDHGITSAALEVRHGGGEVTRTPLPLPADIGDRALVAAAIDLAAPGLTPGDTLRYVATATDNAPARHVGRSREYLVRIPTEAEARAARSHETAATATRFDSLTQQATRVQRTEEDLARERPVTSPATPNAAAAQPGQREPLASEAARKAQAVAQAQQQVLDDAAKLQQSVQQLRDAAERAGVTDSALARQLDEIRQLLDKALSPELRAQLAALQQAVKALDAEQTSQALQNLAQQQARLKEALDQARELFKRAALETDLANMAKDADQLAREQQEIAGRLGRSDSSAPGAEQALARRADSLGSGLDRAAAGIGAPQPRQALQQAGRQARQATGAMQQAAQSGEAGKSGEAQGEARQAEDALRPLAKSIDESRRNMQSQMRAEVLRALDRALQETARLSQQQIAVADAFQQGALVSPTRISQGLVEEGAARLGEQVATLAAMNALVSPQAAIAIATARQLMRQAVAAVATVNANVREADEASAQAVDALAVAAYALLRSKDRVNGSQSGSGVQEAMEEMQRMAGQQGQLGQQGAAMMQQGFASTQQLLQLALQQRALAQQLERLRAGGQLPGAGELAREAKDLARTLEAGRLTQDVVGRQQVLFKRMLDAGRTLQGEQDDENKERQSMTAKDAPPAVPPPLDPRIRNGTGEIRLPGWDALQRLSPDERRRVVEYFQRLAQGPKP